MTAAERLGVALWYVRRMWGIHLGFYRWIEGSENCRIPVYFVRSLLYHNLLFASVVRHYGLEVLRPCCFPLP